MERPTRTIGRSYSAVPGASGGALLIRFLVGCHARAMGSVYRSRSQVSGKGAGGQRIDCPASYFAGVVLVVRARGAALGDADVCDSCFSRADSCRDASPGDSGRMDAGGTWPDLAPCTACPMERSCASFAARFHRANRFVTVSPPPEDRRLVFTGWQIAL